MTTRHFPARTWDIFCSVVDNFGDIGVCWRLARQLSSELGQSVRLWVDDLARFRCLCAEVDPARASQYIAEVEVRQWRTPFAQVEPADIVIEGFGARLPEVYLEAMAARRPHPAWVNLEYLSAERWVETHHRLPSPHPSLPLVKHFFFPGFTSATGGLLMECDLPRLRDAFQSDPAALAAFWHSLGVVFSNGQALRISLFCYENPALAALVEQWAAASTPAICLVPAGAALAQLTRITGRAIAIGAGITLGRLSIQAIPFLELDQYDRLLWACDLNFVRGEDSFVRAQLAARPLIWHAYPQQESAHLPKISAFIERYSTALDAEARSAYASFSMAWNGGSAPVGLNWGDLCRQWQALTEHARDWAQQLSAGGSLAFKLAEFCEDRLK
ncbi:MAG TPA: elongation factor P maturation arginine rhamnosyltransferase EarP [Burkholderiales bacterium]|nr:elongation factor P maturation arginine rhamnosyltransferase EarP [Burkholderiales bacterium]